MTELYDAAKHITLPVKSVDGRWELVYGGGIPAKEGTFGELKIALSAIEGLAFRERVTQEAVVRVLPQGTALLIALNDPDWRGPLYSGFKIAKADVPVGATRFEVVMIGRASPATRKLDPEHGGLWMHQIGVHRCELIASTVTLPDGSDPATATSLNHAFTMLSERFERHRISHTGNVYTRVFYKEADDTWCALERLRSGLVAGAERKVIADAWAELERQLGWRPIDVPSGRKRRR